MANKIDVTDAQLAIINNIIAVNVPPEIKVWAFGSRAKFTAKPFSDLDLALENSDNSRINPQILYNLRDAFEYSDLPWKVDVLDLNSIEPNFRKIIEANKINFAT